VYFEILDLTGEQFGELIVLDLAGTDPPAQNVVPEQNGEGLERQ
jgi:hypothetical protein